MVSTNKTVFQLGDLIITLHCRIPRTLLLNQLVAWRSISMRAGPAFLQFDWLKAGLSMDLSVFAYSNTKTSFKFLSRQGTYTAAFYVVTDLTVLQTTQKEPYAGINFIHNHPPPGHDLKGAKTLPLGQSFCTKTLSSG